MSITIQPVEGSSRRGGARAGKRQLSVSSIDVVVTVVAVIVVLAGLSVSLIFPPSEPDAPAEDEGRRTTPAAAAVVPTPDPSVTEGVVIPPLAMEAERESAKLVCQAQLGTQEFTALSYNIKSGRAGGLERLLGAMQRSQAEVILLQEVDNRRRSTGSVDQAAWFASRLGGWHSAFGRNVTFGDGLYGTAVVSKFPIVSSTNTPLPNIGRAQPRGLLHVVINVSGVEVSIYSTHLDNTSNEIRARQGSTIASILSRDPRPKIIGGDMNAGSTSPALRAMSGEDTDTWAKVGTGSGGTFFGRGARIDYLLHGGPGLTPLSSDVIPDNSSDHRPVRARYELGGIKTEKCTGGKASKGPKQAE